MSEEMFGLEPGGTEEWGGDIPPGEPGGEGVSGTIQDLGNGTFIRVDEAIIKQFLHAPAAIAAIQNRGRQVADLANANHITKGAEYEAVLVDNPNYKRPVVFVKPANYKGVVDEQYHSTLYAAAAQVGSDPIIEPGQMTEAVE